MLHARPLNLTDTPGQTAYRAKTIAYRSPFALQKVLSQKLNRPVTVVRKNGSNVIPGTVAISAPNPSSVKYLAIPMDSLLLNGGNPITIQILYSKPQTKESVSSSTNQLPTSIDGPMTSSTDLASDPFLCQRMDEPANNNLVDDHASDIELYKSGENDDRLPIFDDYSEFEPQLEPTYEDFHSPFAEMEPASLFQGTVIKRSLDGYVLPNKPDPITQKKFKCTFPNCGKMFERQRSLKYHHITHAPPVFSCNICQKRFVTMPKLKRHLRIHNGERPFKCEECGKSFSTNSNLSVHRRKHTGEKPFACSICGRLFAHHSHAKTHLKVHEKERNYRNAQSFTRMSSSDWPYLQK